MAMSGSKRRNRAASAQGQEADIAVPALDPRSWGVRKTLVFRTSRVHPAPAGLLHLNPLAWLPMFKLVPDQPIHAPVARLIRANLPPALN